MPQHQRWSTDDRRFMRQALALAWQAQGRVAPNPAVGAVVVRDGMVVGAGCTHPPGGPHAEIVALCQAGEQARGATLYVTLEPCAHYGRTPPCTEALLAAGIARVVAAFRDPFPAVNGRGFAQLQHAGVAVAVGLEKRRAVEVNAGYLKRLQTGMPEVTVKYAITLDGRIATRTGNSRWITSAPARLLAHQLRDQHDAIMVGIGTVLADDPLLTTRIPAEHAGLGGPHHPLRVIVDRLARTPPTAALLAPDLPGRTVIACTDEAPVERRQALSAAGADVVVLPRSDRGVDLRALLCHLGKGGINRVLVEGGGTLIGSLFDDDLVDQVYVLIAPLIVGGRTAPGPVGGDGVALLAHAWRLRHVHVRRLGPDIMVHGRIHPLPKV